MKHKGSSRQITKSEPFHPPAELIAEFQLSKMSEDRGLYQVVRWPSVEPVEGYWICERTSKSDDAEKYFVVYTKWHGKIERELLQKGELPPPKMNPIVETARANLESRVIEDLYEQLCQIHVPALVKTKRLVLDGTSYLLRFEGQVSARYRWIATLPPSGWEPLEKVVRETIAHANARLFKSKQNT